MTHTETVSAFSIEEIVNITVFTLQLLVTVTSNSNSNTDTKIVPKSHQITFYSTNKVT